MIIREATKQDIPAIAKVHVDTWKTTYRDIFPDEFLNNLSDQKREQDWHQVFERKENKLIEIVYGWNDISNIRFLF